MKRKLPKSIRKYIRKEKARIRREVFDLEEQKKLIEKLYQKLMPRSEFPTGPDGVGTEKARGIIKELTNQNES